MKAKSSFRINRIHPVTNGVFNLLFVLLACAIAIELVVLSIVRARMGHTGKEEVTKS